MIIKIALKEDLPQILEIQKLAFPEEAELYNDYSIEPLMQTIDILNEEFDNKIFIKAVLDNKIIGSARANWYQKSCWINKVVVHPAYQNQGIGKRLMHEIENCFNEADKHILYTGYKSKRNLHLYKKLGYKKVKSGQHANNVHLIHLEKINKYGNTK